MAADLLAEALNFYFLNPKNVCAPLAQSQYAGTFQVEGSREGSEEQEQEQEVDSSG